MAVESFLDALGSGFREPGGQADRGRCAAEFIAESWKLLGIAAYWAGDLNTAAEAVRTGRRLARFEGDRLVLDEYMDRIAGDRNPPH